GRNGDSDKDFYLNADEYAYDEIYIKVTTLVSNSDTNTITIGRSSEDTATVKKRLSQPLAVNYTAADIDELLYSFNWSAYTDEDEIEACAGYKLMISYVNESAETVKEQIESTTTETEMESISMDDYAGLEVTMYIVGVADTTTNYIDSLPGAVITFTVASRYDQPSAVYTLVETDDTTVTELTETVISEDEFTNMLGLNIIVTPGANNGSTYIVSGILCEDSTVAQTIINDLGSSTVADDNTNKEIMERVNAVLALIENGTYEALTFGFDQTINSSDTDITIKANGNFTTDWTTDYAQYYLIPFIRNGGAENGTSIYNWNDSYLTLPKVKLNTPTVSYDEVTGVSASGITYDATFGSASGYIDAENLKFQKFVIERTGDGIPEYYEIAIDDVIKNVVDETSGVKVITEQIHDLVIKIFTDDSSIEIVDSYNGEDTTYTDPGDYTSYGYGHLNTSTVACNFAFYEFAMSIDIADNFKSIVITMPNIASGNYTINVYDLDNEYLDAGNITYSGYCTGVVNVMAVMDTSEEEDKKFESSDTGTWSSQ
nr:hypothetical protein [Butyrivibrio sp.]